MKFHGVPSETAHANYTENRGALFGIISAKRILYHAHVAALRRRDEIISWRAAGDTAGPFVPRIKNAASRAQLSRVQTKWMFEENIT